MENNKIVYRTFITTMQMLRDRNYSEGSLLSISKNQLVNISKLKVPTSPLSFIISGS